jgi:hypothetical protein
MNVWGEDKVRELDKYQVGDKVKVSFNLSAREYNGRWYNDIRAWRIEPAGAAPAAAPSPVPPAPAAPPPTEAPAFDAVSDEDLPF